ncbi:MAG TPA: hypothetical protein VGV89_01110 [Thermoplasmata archaeon]|nr:hypothetical protein [Thermoplasmata archaeon]
MFDLQLALWPVAAVMALITAGLIKWASEATTELQGGVVLFLLAMMAAMFGGAAIYFAAPGARSAVAGLWVSAVVMAVSVFPLIALFLSDARRRLSQGERYVPALLERTYAFAASVIGLVLLNELLMAWAFGMGAGGIPAGSAGISAQPAIFARVIASPWFLFPMAGEMALTVWLVRSRLPLAVVGLLSSQAGLMILSAPAFPGRAATDLIVVLGSAVMIGIIVFVMEYLYRHRQLAAGLSGYVLALLSIFALMMVGLYTWVAYGNALVFAGSILLEMVLFFDAIVRPERLSGELSPPWQLRPNWTFGVLATIFLGELFMGAVLDIVLLPGVYLSALPSLPLTGGLGTILYDAVYNGFWFVALVAGSTWFLAMMGVEMGILVLFKFRETVSRENKVRLALVIGSYALFATFFPSYYYTALLPNAPSGTTVPVLGWSMGLGSAPIVPSLFLVIFVSYAITGSLVLLFGRRVICGVFCTPALMYAGTTFNAMSSFNRSSPLARKYLGSRFSSIYSASTGLAMGSLVAVSFLSYFDQTGVLHVSILGADPSVFFFALCFGVIWFAVFVTIPYTGNYNCVTMGWCYTGQIAAAFSRIGFFKLKVRDRQVCKDCTTLDCAKSCPVGLVDMPGHFRQKGEFRSSKCCGVGGCVGACPYGNLYISDVRHWLRLRRTPATPVLELPVVRGISRPSVSSTRASSTVATRGTE